MCIIEPKRVTENALLMHGFVTKRKDLFQTYTADWNTYYEQSILLTSGVHPKNRGSVNF